MATCARNFCHPLRVKTMARSEAKTDSFGSKYTEYYDNDGHIVGESREREDFFGKYTEYYDDSGHKVAESTKANPFVIACRAVSIIAGGILLVTNLGGNAFVGVGLGLIAFLIA